MYGYLPIDKPNHSVRVNAAMNILLKVLAGIAVGLILGVVFILFILWLGSI